MKKSIKKAAVSTKVESKKEEACECQPSNTKLWCVTLMAVAIIVLTWVSSATWSKVIVTVLAGLVFIRSMMINCGHCCK